MPAKWQEVRIPAGQMTSDDIPISADVISAPPGRVTTADGAKLKGNQRPRYTISETSATTCKIVLNDAHDADLVFKVKAEEEAED